MTQPATPIVFYGFALSGHSHRVELFLKLLDLPYQAVWVDLAKGEQKAPDYVARHPFGQVPMIDDGGTVLWDSSAILVYLASKYDDGRWLPNDPVGRAEVQRWLSVAAGQLAAGPAAARVCVIFKRGGDLDAMQEGAHRLFATMDAFLGAHDYLAAGRPTIADLAMYAYTAHAPEGGVDLALYPNIGAWISRLEALPRFYTMVRSEAGLWAA